MAEQTYSGEYNPTNLPFSAEAEQAVLGAIIIDNAMFDNVLDYVKTADYFYISLHKVIFEAMQEMMNFGRAIDFVTLLDKLKQNSGFEEATGKTYLVDLVDNCPAPSNAEAYAKIVADKYKLRRLITAAREIIDDAAAAEDDPTVLLDSAEQRIFDIRSGSEKGGLERLSAVLLQTFERLDSLNREADESVRPVSTGIGDLDRVITGLNRSDLIILAARPGMGKTSFALNIARNVACQSQKTVAFFSLEMSKEQLASRLLSAEAMVGGTKLRSGKLTDEEWQRLVPASDILKNAKMYIDDTPGVVVDYLQLMSSTRRIESRVNEISEITRSLKIMAKELNVPVITLSQLSRASEQRPDHRPQLSDLRDSGSIEQDADIVLFLYRDGYYDKNGEDDAGAPAVDVNSGECIVAKNRHGEMSTVKLHWQGEFMRFTNVETRYG